VADGDGDVVASFEKEDQGAEADVAGCAGEEGDWFWHFFVFCLEV